MPLVPAVCTQCGAELRVDSAHEAAVCQFCNTPFIVEKAIQNYTTNNYIKADVVNLGGDLNLDNRLKAANTFLAMKEYDKAYGMFYKISEDYPYDYRGWWGLVRIVSLDFTEIRYTVYEKAKSFYDKAYFAASQSGSLEDVKKIAGVFEEYSNKALQRYNTNKATYDEAMTGVNKKINEVKEKKSLRHKIVNAIQFATAGIGGLLWFGSMVITYLVEKNVADAIYMAFSGIFIFGAPIGIVFFISNYVHGKMRNKLLSEQRALEQAAKQIDYNYKQSL